MIFSIFLGIQKILEIQSSDTNQIKNQNVCSMFIIINGSE